MSAALGERVDLKVCADCVRMIASGEGTDEHADKMLREWPSALLVLNTPGEGQEPEGLGVHNSLCDGCGSDLAGDRFAAVAFVDD